MINFFQNTKKYIPSPQMIQKMIATIEANLDEINKIIAEINETKNRLYNVKSLPPLYYFGSLLYEFYLAVEESMLMVAKVTDRWVPCRLDWHEHLLKQMQAHLPDTRPAVISPTTAALLNNYLYFYLTFPQQYSRLSLAKVKKLVEDLETVFPVLKRDFDIFVGIFGGHLPQK